MIILLALYNAGSKKFFYGWIVLFLCFLVLVVSLGVRLSFGAFITSWEAEFQVNRGTLALISATGLIFYGIFQPVAGRLSDLLGARFVLSGSMAIIGLSLIIIQWLNNLWVLGIVYGILISIGYAGTSNVVASAIVIQWFQKRQGLALGLVTSGMAVGQMVIVPLSIYMVGNWQWKLTFLIFGLTILFIVTPLIFAFIRSKPKDMGLKPYGMEQSNFSMRNLYHPSTPAGEKDFVLREPRVDESIFNLFKARTFWLLMLPYFFCGFTDLGLINTHLIPYAEGKNFSSHAIAFTIGLMAAFNIVGTIVAGYVSDYINRTRLLATIYMVRAFSFLVLLFLPGQSTVLLVIFGITYGITDMAPVAIVSSLCAKLFGKYAIGAVIGVMSACHQVGAAFGSFLPGMLYDWTGGYYVSFLFSVFALVAVSALVLLIRDKRSSSSFRNFQKASEL